MLVLEVGDVDSLTGTEIDEAAALASAEEVFETTSIVSVLGGGDDLAAAES